GTGGRRGASRGGPSPGRQLRRRRPVPRAVARYRTGGKVLRRARRAGRTLGSLGRALRDQVGGRAVRRGGSSGRRVRVGALAEQLIAAGLAGMVGRTTSV